MQKEINNAETVLAKPKRQASIPESATYGLYFLGQNIIYWLITNWQLYYYTEEALITPLAVTVIFLIAKVWDAINDPIFGMIVDKTRFKKDQFKPWIKVSSLLLPLSTVLVFSIPADFSMGWKIALAFITYAIWDVLYTVSDAPAFALATVMTDNVKERSNLVAYGRMGALFGGIVIGVVAPILIQQNGMQLTTILLAVVAVVTMVPIGFIAKERTTEKNRELQEEQEEHGFKEMFEYIKGNKYLLVFFGSLIIHGVFKVTLGNYVAEHLIGNLAINGIIAIFALPAMFSVYIFIPLLTKRIDKMTIYKASLLASILMSIFVYFVGYQNIQLYIIVTIIKTVFDGFTGTLMFTFSADALEYGHYKTGIRKEGITFSLQTFTAKFTAAIAGVVTSLVLVVIGYQGNMAVTESMQHGIWLASCFLPSLGALLSYPLLMKYRLKDSDVQIMANINSGEISREAGEAMMSREY